MNTISFSLAAFAGLLCATPSTPVQNSSSTSPSTRGGGLVRVSADGSATDDDPSPQASKFERDEWKRKLGVADLDARERALDALVQIARDDRDARRALEEWSRDRDAAELAWTSRLALRELERTASTPSPRRSLAGPLGSGRFGRGFEDLQRQMDEMQRNFGGMDSMFENLQREMRELLDRQGAPMVPGVPGTAPIPGAMSHGESFSMKSGPDGVEVEVLEDENGTQQKKTYKADTLDELLDAHPELRDRISIGHGLSPFGAPRAHSNSPWWRSNDPQDDEPFNGSARPLQPSAPGMATPPAQPSGERLGIYCATVGADELEKLGSDRNGGLRVQSVVQGSLAELLGLRRGDVLIELDGKPIESTDDVAAVLRDRQRGAELKADVLDAHGKSRTLRFKPQESSGQTKGEPGGSNDAQSGKRF